MWTVGLIVEIKLRFRDGLAWTVDLTVEIKLRFRDGLLWMLKNQTKNKKKPMSIKLQRRFRETTSAFIGFLVLLTFF